MCGSDSHGEAGGAGRTEARGGRVHTVDSAWSEARGRAHGGRGVGGGAGPCARRG